jgi:hypothetical protein
MELLSTLISHSYQKLNNLLLSNFQPQERLTKLIGSVNQLVCMLRHYKLLKI